MGERAQDPPAGRAERMADGDRAAEHVDLLRVESRPRTHAGERLRRERLVELEEVDVAPADARALERAVGGLHRADAEDVGIDAERAAARDARERLAVEALARE